MPKEIMRRKAADNEYLHKDFHLALNAAIEYLHKRQGAEAVREYLRQFALAFYSPLMARIKRSGLKALEDHFKRIYKIEKGAIRIRRTRDDLILEVDACPAVAHMHAKKCKPTRLFYETSRTIHAALCEGSPFDFEWVSYDPKTGRSVQRFYRRSV